MLSNDQIFQLLASIFIPFLVALIMAVGDKLGTVWFRLNAPTVAATAGGLIGAIYHVEAVYRYLHNMAPAGSPADFIVSGILAGFAGAGIKSLAKDFKSGAFTATSEADVMKMRRGNDSKDGIGS